ncbi:MAG: aldehyde dehydrogenase family protein, partial [Actinobacteria bacterium]|nr:aldehyde dehydrogenase family protein [Actinomycetota bacterium]
RTAKLFIGGAFPRSESGRTYEVKSPEGKFIANAAQGSRKDARDAVTAARAIQPKWAGATAYNRGQILYRIAEMMEGRRAQFIDEVSPWAKSAKKAESEVDEAIDRWIWFAGWSDKIAMVVGSSNPVAGPFFNFSVPEPTGVVAAIAPSRPSLLGLVDTIAPIIVSGNTTVVIASQDAPMAAVTLGEVLATSDLPGGVINILTGSYAEVAPWLASHMDVNAIDLSGVDDEKVAAELEKASAENLKRYLRPGTELDGLTRIKNWLELKTVWHPRGF